MPATPMQIEKLNRKFDNLIIHAVAYSEDRKHVDIFAIKYNKHAATPDKMSQGLIEANAVWDERQSRPKGYYIAHTFEKENGYCTSVMVSEEWLDRNKASAKRAEWEETL